MKWRKFCTKKCNSEKTLAAALLWCGSPASHSLLSWVDERLVRGVLPADVAREFLSGSADGRALSLSEMALKGYAFLSLGLHLEVSFVAVVSLAPQVCTILLSGPILTDVY